MNKEKLIILYDINLESYLLVNKTSIDRFFKKETLINLIEDWWKDLDEKEKIYKYKNKLKEFKDELLSKKITCKVMFNTQKDFGLFKKDGIKYFNTFLQPEWKSYVKKKTKKYNFVDYLNNKKLKYTKLLLKNLTKGEEAKIEFIINYIAKITQTFKKIPHSIIFYGEQGTGKGVFAEYILKKIVGERQFYVFSNQDLENTFNGFLENKLILIGNEIKDYSTSKNIMNKLKMWVTDNQISLNYKHSNQKMVKNHFNLFIFTNELIPLQTESDDRRYTLIKTNDVELLQYIQQETKQKINFEFLEKELEKEFKILIDLLYNYNINENLIRRPLETKEKIENKKRTELKYKLVNNYLKNKNKKDLFEILLEYIEDFNDNEFKEYLFDKYNLNLLEHILIESNDKIDKEETIKNFLDVIFKRLEKENIIFNLELKFILRIFYHDKKESELNLFLKNIGVQGGIKQINNKKFRYRIIKATQKTNNTTLNEAKEKNEIERLKKEIEQLKKENKQLKKENEQLKTQIEIYKLQNPHITTPPTLKGILPSLEVEGEDPF